MCSCMSLIYVKYVLILYIPILFCYFMCSCLVRDDPIKKYKQTYQNMIVGARMYPFLVTTIDKTKTNLRYIKITALENNNGMAEILILQKSKPNKSVAKLINVSHILWSIRYLIHFLLTMINLTNIAEEWAPL